MKTNIFSLFIMIVAIVMGTPCAHAQVSDVTSFVINAEAGQPVQAGDIFTSQKFISGYGDSYVQFDESGVLSADTIVLHPASDPGGSVEILSISGSFATARTHADLVNGWSYAVFYSNPVTGDMKQIRTARQVAMHAFQINENLVAVTFYPTGGATQTMGANLDGGIYGGDIGISGPDVVSLGSFSVYDVGVMFLDTTGAIVDEIGRFDLTEPAVIKGVQEFSTDYAFEVRYGSTIGTGDSTQFVLVDKTDIATAGLVDMSKSTEIYPCLVDGAYIDETPSGEFVVSIKPTGIAPGFIDKFDASLSLIEDNREYSSLGSGGGFNIFVSNNVLVTDGYAGKVVGSDQLDSRYSFAKLDLAGYDHYTASVDFMTMEARIIGYYTGSGNILGGNALVDVPAGQTGIFFCTIDLAESGARFTLSNANSNVIEAFAYKTRSDIDPNEMVTTNDHIGYLQVATLPTVGTAVPADYYAGPGAGWTLLPSVDFQLDSLTGETYFLLVASNPAYPEAQFKKVICTTDDLFEPIINTAPVISGVVGGTIDCGTALSGDNHEVVINYTDADGDVCTAFLDAGTHPEISLTNGGGSNFSVFFGNVPQGDLEFTFYLTDGIDTVFAVGTIDINGTVSVSELEKIDFTVYPNPATDVLNIQSLAQGGEVFVHDMSGRLMLTDRMSSDVYQLSLYDYAPGTYLVTVKTETSYSQVKFIKR